jgi:hypothetical protein
MNSTLDELEIAQIRERLRLLEIMQRVIDARCRALNETPTATPHRRNVPANSIRNARRALDQYPHLGGLR